QSPWYRRELLAASRSERRTGSSRTRLSGASKSLILDRRDLPHTALARERDEHLVTARVFLVDARVVAAAVQPRLVVVAIAHLRGISADRLDGGRYVDRPLDDVTRGCVAL